MLSFPMKYVQYNWTLVFEDLKVQNLAKHWSQKMTQKYELNEFWAQIHIIVKVPL